jgi:hypothetical protein
MNLEDYVFAKGGRQKYEDVSLLDLQAKCNCFQLKYDGYWCALIREEHAAMTKVFSRHGKFKHELALDMPDNTILIGECLEGTQWATKRYDYGSIAVFDCVMNRGIPLKGCSYAYRSQTYEQIVLNSQDGMLKSIPSFVSVNYDALTQEQFEGFVGRNLADAWSEPVFRHKFTVTDVVTITKVNAGKGRLSALMGNLTCVGTYLGREYTINVGGGFSDQLRRASINGTLLVPGVQIEISGKARFDSGALRHPNFVRIME